MSGIGRGKGATERAKATQSQGPFGVPRKGQWGCHMDKKRSLEPQGDEGGLPKKPSIVRSASMPEPAPEDGKVRRGEPACHGAGSFLSRLAVRPQSPPSLPMRFPGSLPRSHSLLMPRLCVCVPLPARPLHDPVSESVAVRGPASGAAEEQGAVRSGGGR